MAILTIIIEESELGLMSMGANWEPQPRTMVEQMFANQLYQILEAVGKDLGKSGSHITLGGEAADKAFKEQFRKYDESGENPPLQGKN
jgi:hypothetical protein